MVSEIIFIHRRILGGQRGSVINVALLILILLTLLGITFVELSSTDIKVAGNDRTTKMAFYAAEASRSYIVQTLSLYDGTNVAESQPKTFPLVADAGIVSTSLGSKQSFSGTVQYLGTSPLPRGSTNSTDSDDSLVAHWYKMICTGTGPRNAKVSIESGFYRLGY